MTDPINEEKGAPSNRVYVGNLDYGVKWQELKDHMRTCGNVVRADVMTIGNKMDARSKGCGIVVYETPEEAAKAIATLNNTELQSRVIFVREDREPLNSGGGGSTYQNSGSPTMHHDYNRGTTPYGDRGGESKRNNSYGNEDTLERQVFISNLNFRTGWQDVKDMFRKHDLNVVRADVFNDPNTRRSKGVGIAIFATREDAEAAIQARNGVEFQGRILSLRMDNERRPSPRSGKDSHRENDDVEEHAEEMEEVQA